jgi:p21-activated kinase 1
MSSFWKKFTLKKKGTKKKSQDEDKEEDVKFSHDVTDDEKEKFRNLPPAALRVFKSSGLTYRESLQHWDVFLNCLYYSTPKKTFAKPPPVSFNNEFSSSQFNLLAYSHESKTVTEDDTSSELSDSFDLLKDNAVHSSGSESSSSSEGDEDGEEWMEGSNRSLDSSTLDSDFDPKYFFHMRAMFNNEEKKKPKRKRHFTAAEKDLLVKKGNPKDYYKDFHEIGKGAYGKVYIAQEKNSKRKLAIKHMKRNWDDDGDSMANEIVLLDSSHQKNIVNYICSYLWENKIWMVMEYCDAGTLKQLLVIEMNEGQIANVLKQVLTGLEYLHSFHRIHRDIKSANILLNMNGDVKVADLGLCIEGEGEQSGMAGSKYWMAPEMIKRMPYNSKVDIWSVGCVGVEMAEGNPPNSQYKPLKALFFTATKGAPELRRKEKWTTGFRDFLKLCFKSDPAERPTATDLLKDEFLSKACESKELVKALKLVFLMRVTAGL